MFFVPITPPSLSIMLTLKDEHQQEMFKAMLVPYHLRAKPRERLRLVIDNSRKPIGSQLTK